MAAEYTNLASEIVRELYIVTTDSVSFTKKG